ncbi:hypothetical protein BJ138DRAFT_1116497 [Hygrophoropsis aurantiaca]|uniref:Uncharacterized protein n=1 Tax=Hygrophoropsis aurantiaca TaxID=72124 RepID=A0ACB8A398_9AGAM|nr:hypothetical protein BJ138DRAFT_1116497 [Hygrophoropsis aurantiaca]
MSYRASVAFLCVMMYAYLTAICMLTIYCCFPNTLAFHQVIPRPSPHYHRAHVSHMRVRRLNTLKEANFFTIFISGVCDRLTPMVVTKSTIIGSVFDHLIARGLVPSNYATSHYLCAPGMFTQPLKASDSLQSIGLCSMGSLYLRVRHPGGSNMRRAHDSIAHDANEPGPSSQVIHVTEAMVQQGHAMRKRQRKSKPKLIFRKDPATSAVKRRHHSDFVSQGNGAVSQMKKVITTAGTSQGVTSTHQMIFDDVPAPHNPENEDHLQTEVPLDILEPTKRKRTAGDHPLLTWINFRDVYLQELLRLEGRGDHAADNSMCDMCQLEVGFFRCQDCFGVDLFCKECTLTKHAQSPLHRIQKWNGEFFERTSLKNLGLRIQLGHKIGKTCAVPERAFGDDFVVVDSHQIHEVSVDFCGCETSQDRVKQLLRMRWFPATTTDPKTAATFRVLEQFHLLSFESKASSYEYYSSLSRATDNTGLMHLKERYEAFMRMVREWRHLKSLKRAGRGYDPNGVAATREGECAIVCPACPQPGKNLPEDWDKGPACKRWLYALFIAIDANFRLKRKHVSKDSVDPSLGQGWSYFVQEKPYKGFLEKYINFPQEKSTCSSHSAVNNADTKCNKGLAATGVGTIDCARHNMKLPTGVGDLQKGEKYINMDYLFYSALRHSMTNTLNISYDIACQWHKNLRARMPMFPEDMHLDFPSKFITYFVPKFHLPAHISSCQVKFSFNFIPGVGRTDGEAPERGWANMNPVSSSTKEMGPGNRRDTLDDHFGDWNWKKVTSFGKSMLRKMKDAVPARGEHRSALEMFESALNETHADALKRWTNAVETWEADHSKPNPYVATVDTLSLASVRLELAKDEAEDISNGRNNSLDEDVSPSALISLGLDLEDLQRRLRNDKANLGNHPTDIQLASLQQRSNALQRRIDAWKKIQLLYIPTVAILRAQEHRQNAAHSATTIPADAVENTKLWLPSQIGNAAPCDVSLRSIEWKLRYAQAHDALHGLRQALRLEIYLLRYKDRFISGQKPITRAQSAIDNAAAKKDGCAERYRDARKALLVLGPLLEQPDGWKLSLRPLEREDIRYMVELGGSASEGRRQLTWIWMVRGAAVDSADTVGLQDEVHDQY